MLPDWQTFAFSRKKSPPPPAGPKYCRVKVSAMTFELSLSRICKSIQTFFFQATFLTQARTTKKVWIVLKMGCMFALTADSENTLTISRHGIAPMRGCGGLSDEFVSMASGLFLRYSFNFTLQPVARFLLLENGKKRKNKPINSKITGYLEKLIAQTL
jgi:hypothetical protein